MAARGPRLSEDYQGHLTSGGSLANFIALAVARHVKGGKSVRSKGVRGKKWVVYGSTATHYSIPKALDMLGLGSDAFRAIPVTERFEINLASLEKAIARDRKRGLKPIGVVGNAGTVGTGAIDPLDGLADFALKEKLWFHVDGAIGATAVFSDRHRGRRGSKERIRSPSTFISGSPNPTTSGVSWWQTAGRSRVLFPTKLPTPARCLTHSPIRPSSLLTAGPSSRERCAASRSGFR